MTPGIQVKILSMGNCVLYVCKILLMHTNLLFNIQEFTLTTTDKSTKQRQRFQTAITR